MSPPRGWPDRNEVHVWQACLDVDDHDLRELQSHLSAAELAGAARQRHERDRRRHVAARGWLRLLLGDYLRVDPGSLAFVLGEHGKPRLAGAAERQLMFNVSHSEDTTLFAVARGREVGVDIERVRDDASVLDVARRYFSKPEQDMLEGLAAAVRAHAFFECWTRKEAVLKAIGVGLSGHTGSPADDAEWSLHSLDAGPNFVAALAVAGVARVPDSARTLRLSSTTRAAAMTGVAVVRRP